MVRHALGLAIAQQRNEACLLKVLVMGEGFRKVSFLHDQKRGTVNETPLLVRPLSIEGQSGLKLFVGLWDNFNFPSLLEAPHDLYGLLSKRLTERSVIVEKFS